MYLVTIGEIFLKGKNRNQFENRLIRNIKIALGLKKDEIKILRNRYIIYRDNVDNLKYVFGIKHYCKTEECEFSQINKVCLNLVGKEKTFRITAHRSDKNYKTSQEIEKETGAYIAEKKKIKVKLENPEINIHVNIIKDKAYVYTKKVYGLGGLPVGSSGYVYVIVKDPIRSAVASYLMMKRGCKIGLSEEIQILKKFEYGFELKVKPKKDYDVLVTDETITDITLTGDIQTTLRPLIGYMEKEIKYIYEKMNKL